MKEGNMKRALLVFALALVVSMDVTSVQVSAGPPPVPQNVQASDGTYFDLIRVTWSPSPGACYYKVYRSTVSPGWTWIGNVAAPVFDDYTAPHDLVRSYKVSAVDEFGKYSSLSLDDSGYRGLAAPANVQATEGTHWDRVCLSWDEVDGASGYEVLTGTDPNHYYKTTDTSVASLCDYDVDPGVLYYYWVRAENSVDESALSPYETGYRQLDDPTNVDASTSYCDRIHITWDAVEGATTYRVRRGPPQGPAEIIAETAKTFHDDYSSAPSMRHAYFVFACASTGCTSRLIGGSDGYWGPPARPAGTAASDGLYPDKVRVTWYATDFTSSYQVERASLRPDLYVTIADGLKTNQYDDTDVVQGRVYYYRVSGRNACGCGSYGTHDYGSAQISTPTPTNTPTFTPTPKPTATPTHTLTPESTATPTHTRVPAATPTSTGTPTPTPRPDYGPWDGDRISAPRVIHDVSGYRMWYDGYNSADDRWGVGLAQSVNGCGWFKHSSSPILRPGPAGQWDDYIRYQVAILKGTDIHEMWFSGSGGDTWQTGYATSTDGVDWDVYAGNPVLRVGANGAWDEFEADGPAVIKESGVYKMWYHGCNDGYQSCAIGYATSSDGIHWTKHASNPVLSGDAAEWDERGTVWPALIHDGSNYEMWYYGLPGGGIGHATSPDGIHWTKDPNNPVLPQSWNGLSPAQPSVLLEDGTYKMWFRQGSAGDSAIAYAESPDGTHWTLMPCSPVLIPGPMGGLWLPLIMRR
jgi:fibronectin type 3 domain-containing protein